MLNKSLDLSRTPAQAVNPTTADKRGPNCRSAARPSGNVPRWRRRHWGGDHFVLPRLDHRRPDEGSSATSRRRTARGSTPRRSAWQSMHRMSLAATP